MVSGNQVVARVLAAAGVQNAVGVVGVPVTGLAEELQRRAVPFYAFRNEQVPRRAIGRARSRPCGCLTGHAAASEQTC